MDRCGGRADQDADAVRTERGRLDHSLVRKRWTGWIAARDLPHLTDTVSIACEGAIPAGTEHDDVDTVLVGNGCDILTRVRLPQEGAGVIDPFFREEGRTPRTGENPLAILAEGRRGHAGGVNQGRAGEL